MRVFELYLSVDALADSAIVAAGYEPDGYFWESLLEFLVQTRAPRLVDSFEPDSESDTFTVFTKRRRVAERLRDLLSPFVSDPAKVTAVITEASAVGFVLAGAKR